MAISIIFNQINVNSINTNANIAIGENNMAGWDNNAKTNIGSASHFGIVVTSGTVSNVFDNDAIDSPYSNSEFKPGITVQTV